MQRVVLAGRVGQQEQHDQDHRYGHATDGVSLNGVAKRMPLPPDWADDGWVGGVRVGRAAVRGCVEMSVSLSTAVVWPGVT